MTTHNHTTRFIATLALAIAFAAAGIQASPSVPAAAAVSASGAGVVPDATLTTFPREGGATGKKTTLAERPTSIAGITSGTVRGPYCSVWSMIKQAMFGVNCEFYAEP